MCLETYRKEPLIAERDIKCYKTIKIVRNKLFSPFENYLLKVGENTTEAEEDTIHSMYPTYPFLEPELKLLYSIGKGFLHAFTLYTDAEKLARTLIGSYHKSIFKVYECFIPKGSKYYIGNYDDICSKRLVLFREISIIIKNY